MKYKIKKEISLTYLEAIKKVKEELLKEGFGILNEIDVKKTFKKKLDVDFNNYIILEACNPNFAYEALNLEIDIGLMLPCNLIVYEKDKKTFVSAINPIIGMGIINNKELNEIANKVKEKLKKVVKNI